MNGVLDGKIALVTGGTGGIGTATCKRLSDRGASAVSTYIAEDKASEWRSAHALKPFQGV